MRTVTTNVYSFDELSDEAKARAIQSVRECGGYLDYDWSDFIIEDAKTIGATIGFTIDNVYFRGFWSQGDGASFTGAYSYQKEWRKKLTDYAPLESEVAAIGERLAAVQRRAFYGLSATVSTSRGPYSHSGTMRASVQGADDYDAPTNVEIAILECARDFAGWIYGRLEKEYEYLMSDEAVTETIVANGYEFHEDGRLA